MNIGKLRNPVWQRSDNLRDPSVLPYGNGYYIFYSRYSNRDWSKEENWSVASVYTEDFVAFSGDRDISPKGYASPGDPIQWHGRYLLPYQTYPVAPARLCYSESADGLSWSEPKLFMPEANDLAWNTNRRVIDPTFVIDGERLFCFFVGTCDTEIQGRRANLVGHAVTSDPGLEKWEILSRKAPLIGRGERAWDGAENVAVFRTGEHWTMIYSEGLHEQHLAYAVSRDLVAWDFRGPLAVPVQAWMATRYGAPYIWKEADTYLMILMGENGESHTTFGLLTSKNGVEWTPLPERS